MNSRNDINAEKAISLLKEGKTLSQTAEALGCSIDAIRKRVHDAGYRNIFSLKEKGLSESQKAYILRYYKGIGPKKMAEIIQAPRRKVDSFYSNHDLNSGLTGRFEKGSVSFNKGKRWSEFMSEEGQRKSRQTCFKKGNKPKNWKPLGSIRYDSNTKTYLIKTKEMHGQGINYEVLNRLEFERMNGRKPKEGMFIRHLNGDENDFSKENLVEVTQGENGVMNRCGLYGEDGLAIAKLMIKIGDRLEDLKRLKEARKNSKKGAKGNGTEHNQRS